MRTEKLIEYHLFSSLIVSKMSAVGGLLAGIFLKCLQVRGKKERLLEERCVMCKRTLGCPMYKMTFILYS